jgi:hypothetical protein
MVLRIRLTHDHQEATAGAIYGLIVSGAVIATSHADTALAVDGAVLVTLVVYWAAERYARIIAERIHEGHRPAWLTVRRQIAKGWELVTASFLPLLTLLVVRAAGAGLTTAEVAALVCSTAVLALCGWRIGEDGRLHQGERMVAAVVAALFGAAMIALKAWLH